MSSELVVDFCSHEAAKYAVQQWHYLGRMSISKTVKVGVWEDGRFVGAITFGYSAGANAHKTYQLTKWEVTELTRVALDTHEHHVSEIVPKAIKLLKSQSPGLRLIISYADPNSGHVGKIYQAMNWIYVGRSTATVYYVDPFGREIHNRTLSSPVGFLSGKIPDDVRKAHAKKMLNWKRSGVLSTIRKTPKYKYLFPLDKGIRRKLMPLALEYPDISGLGVNGDISEVHSEETGSIPVDRSLNENIESE